MDKFESIKAFTQVVEANGFAAAARKMGLSRSAVNKLVINLEDDLKTQLHAPQPPDLGGDADHPGLDPQGVSHQCGSGLL